MASGFNLKQRIGIGLISTLAAVTLLYSCNQDHQSGDVVESDSIDYITVEVIQVPPQYRDETPSFYVDIPQGFMSTDSELVDSDVIDFTESAVEPGVDLLALSDSQVNFKTIGFYWPARDMSMSIGFIRYRTARGSEVTATGKFFDEYFIADPEFILMNQVIIEEREVSFGEYSGMLYYMRPDKEVWHTDTREAVSLILKGETHMIMVETSIFDEGESTPEMMDIAIHIAKSIRIKEESANDE